jgi:ABC-type glutathione transport system ATPase component
MSDQTRERRESTSSAGADAAPALRFRGVGYRYRVDAALALDGIDLEVGAGEVLAVVGGNGSGKSTLARLANGLLAPEAGEVFVGGLSTSDPASLWKVRSRVGLLFQDPEDQIVGATVEDDVAFGLENLGVAREEMHRRVGDVLTSLGLTAEAARSSGWRLPACWCWSPRCSCSTSRPRCSTLPVAPRCSSGSGNWRPEGWRSC